MLVSDLVGHVLTVLGNHSGRTHVPTQIHLWPLLFSTTLYTWVWAELLCQRVDNQSMWAGFGRGPFRHSSKHWSPFRVLLCQKVSFALAGCNSLQQEWATYCIKVFFFTMCEDLNSQLVLYYLHITGLFFSFFLTFFGCIKVLLSQQISTMRSTPVMRLWFLHRSERLEVPKFGLAKL